MTRQEFIHKLKELEVKFTNEYSHMYGSDYYTFYRGASLRVSDHSKNKNSFCYNSYKLGVNDFRSYAEAFAKLHTLCNVNFKNEREEFYRKNESKIVEKINVDGSIDYINGLGGRFSSKDAALNNWFRLSQANY